MFQHKYIYSYYTFTKEYKKYQYNIILVFNDKYLLNQYDG